MSTGLFIYFWVGMKYSKTDLMMVAQLCGYTKNHFKWLNCKIHDYIVVELFSSSEVLACEAARIIQLLTKVGEEGNEMVWS